MNTIIPITTRATDADIDARARRLFCVAMPRASDRLRAIAVDLAARVKAGVYNELPEDDRTDLIGMSLAIEAEAQAVQEIEGRVSAR